MRLGNWKVHQENRNHDLSKKWLQQNSRYAVKVIAKGRFISALRSKELNLQLQLQINFNLWMRQTILWITRYWLPQSSRKIPGQNTDLFIWINNVSDIFFSNFWAGLFSVVPLACCVASLSGFRITRSETHGNIHCSLTCSNWNNYSQIPFKNNYYENTKWLLQHKVLSKAANRCSLQQALHI